MTIDRCRAPLAALLSAALLASAACGSRSDAGDAEAAPADGRGYTRVINVEVEPVRAGSFTEQIRLTGTVQANRDVTVAAEESGPIQRLFVDKGAPVKEGQPLIKIDDGILQAQVDQAQAKARLDQELWQRRKTLWEDEHVGTEQAYLEARADAEESEGSLEALQKRLDRTTIRAPFHGVLEDRMVDRGELVSPGTRVARVVELDTLKVTAGVPERYAADVKPGSPVSVSFDVLPGRTFDGRITFVGHTVNTDSRTFQVEFTLPNPDGLVKPEMVANVSIVRRKLADAVVVPQEALVRIEDGFRAFVVEDSAGQPYVRARDVELGPTQQNRVVVEKGLSPGERLVVVGQQEVAAGDRVRIVGDSAAGGAS